MASTTHWRQFIVRGEKLMRKLSYVFMALSPLCFAAPAFAQGGASSPVNWVAIAAGFSIAIASAICGLAQGRATAAAPGALGRKPAARSGIQFALIRGLAPTRPLALYHRGVIL